MPQVSSSCLPFGVSFPDDNRCRNIVSLAEEFSARVILDTSFWYLGKDNHTAPDSLPPGHRQVALRIKDWDDYAGHLRKIFDEFPDVLFQLAHAGVRKFTPDHAAEVGGLIREYPHVYADLGALRTDSPALEVLVDAAGEDRIMFGTDWPHFGQGRDMSLHEYTGFTLPALKRIESVRKIIDSHSESLCLARNAGDIYALTKWKSPPF